MSIKIMTAVWDRFEGNTTELLLALALADHADDRGENIFPSNHSLAIKTRQTDRSVRRLLSKMRDSGWLISVAGAKGGPRITHEHRIDPNWVKGDLKSGLNENLTRTVATPNPDSCDTNPDSCDTNPDIAVSYNPSRTIIEPSVNHHLLGKQKKVKVDGQKPIEFESLKTIYPKRGGDQGWAEAQRRCVAHIRRGIEWEEILDGARRYAAHVRAVGNEGTQFVKSAAVFCGPDKHFLSDWPIPVNKAQAKQDKNISASIDWLNGDR